MGIDHGMLFQNNDLKRIRSNQINYEYFDENDEDPAAMEMGFTRKLKDILPRLDLLGFTREQANLEYLKAVEEYKEESLYDDDDTEAKTLKDTLSFEEFCTFVAAHPISKLDNVYDRENDHEQIKGRFSGDVTVQRLPNSPLYAQNSYSERSYFGDLIGFLHPYSILRVLGENEQNKEEDVVWQYGPLVENGWAKEIEFATSARRHQTFLIATEGSSDVHILRHAISILRPEIEDFFRFIDVEDGHPFSGAGSLVKFAEGLAKIDVHNQIIFLFDNDGEGVEACNRIKKVPLPQNMRTIRLPSLNEFCIFSTRGPNGIADADINGRAAAIECYLDLNYGVAAKPQVIWTNYKKDLNIYHGALENKESHIKTFLQQTVESIAGGTYNVGKIRRVLDALIAECSSIAEGSTKLNVRPR